VSRPVRPPLTSFQRIERLRRAINTPRRTHPSASYRCRDDSAAAAPASSAGVASTQPAAPAEGSPALSKPQAQKLAQQYPGDPFRFYVLAKYNDA